MNCRACGATIERRDRFCPACGTPNAGTRLHPKFGPVIEGFEPEILYEVAAAGEPACLRCERRITDGSRWCDGCGHDLRASWARHRHQVAVERWRRGETVPRPFRAAGRLGRALQLALLVAAGVASAAVLLRPEVTGAVVAGLAGAVLVTFAAWARRARGNLPALGFVDRRARLVDVVRVRRLVDDLWRSGTAVDELPVCSPAWRTGRRPPALARLWWGSLLLGGALAGAALVTDPATPAAGALSRAAAGLLAVSALLALVLVRGIDRRQARRAALVGGNEVRAPVERVTVGLSTSVPSRHEPLRALPEGRRTTELNRPPSPRRPVWGKY